jgi:hypothetical protein
VEIQVFAGRLGHPALPCSRQALPAPVADHHRDA